MVDADALIVAEETGDGEDSIVAVADNIAAIIITVGTHHSGGHS